MRLICIVKYIVRKVEFKIENMIESETSLMKI